MSGSTHGDRKLRSPAANAATRPSEEAVVICMTRSITRARPAVRGLVLLVASVALATAARAQPTAAGAVRVRVSSATSGEPVPRAVLTLEAPNVTTRRATADDAGAALVRGLAPRVWTVRARALGYQPAQSTVIVRGGDTAVVALRLAPAAHQLPTIRSEERATERAQFEHTPDAGQITLTGSALRSVPSIGEPDVLRAAQLLAGVVARNDYTAGYNVRGGEGDQNLVLLDGIPVYNPFHLGGLFGTFIDQEVGSVDMLVGGFPAEYGGRLSSVLDVHTRDPARSGV